MLQYLNDVHITLVNIIYIASLEKNVKKDDRRSRL